MPTDEMTRAAGETREMRLVSRILGDAGPLSAYLAVRRMPGPSWQTWEQIAYELYRLTGESFTRAGLTNWAERYGIWITTKPTDKPDDYRAAMAVVGIRI